MQTIEDVLGQQPFFAGLDAEALSVLAGCAQNVHFAAGDLLFSEGGEADSFYVVRSGRVALEVHDPRGGTLVVDTADEGDVVGWSWLIPPYRWIFDARAVTAISALQFDGVCLRGKCEADPRLGYALMQRVTQVMYARLQASRIRLLNLYGRP